MKKISLLQSLIVALFFLVSFLLPNTGQSLVSAREKARILPKLDYTVSTTIINNGLPVVNNGRYGDSKFIITPTFKINDSVTLKTGDEIQFVLPNELQFDTAVTRELRTTDGRHFGTLMTDLATKTATIKIVDIAYFEQYSATKLISADITAVWDRVVMPIGRSQLISIEGHPALNLTRIIIDEEPRGISKWGVQDSRNPDLINWRIRINRDLKQVTNARIEDTVPQGQVLHGTIAGHYFRDFYNGPNTRFGAETSINKTSDTTFTIKFKDMVAEGAFIYYQTRVVDHSTIEPLTTNLYNYVTLYRDDAVDPIVAVRGHAKMAALGGGGSAKWPAKTDIVVKKTLLGSALQNQQFQFQLINEDDDTVVATAYNDAAGDVVFKDLTFNSAKTFNYKVKEVGAGSIQNKIYHTTEEIKLPITVVDNNNVLNATVQYPSDVELTNIEVMDITVTKKWDDGDNQDNKRQRPNITLYADGLSTGFETTLAITDDATETFYNLLKFKEDGTPIQYGVVEEQVPGYESPVYAGDADTGFIITNTYKPAKTIVTGEKVWKDHQNQDGLQPEEVTLDIKDGDTVVDTVTVKKTDNWLWTSAELPKYRAGQEIDYTVVERAVPGYTSVVNKVAGRYVVTNTHTPAVQDITGRKTWVDEENHYHYRPEKIVVRLFANDTEVAHQEVSAATNWEYTFSGVPQFEAGAAIVYTVKEDVVDKYDQVINGFDITNTLKPEHTTTTMTTTTTSSTTSTTAATVEPPTISSTSSVDSSTTTTPEESTTITSSEEVTTTTKESTTELTLTTSESSVTTRQEPGAITTPQSLDPTTTGSELTGTPTEGTPSQINSADQGISGAQKVLPKTGDTTNRMTVVLGATLMLVLAALYLYLDKHQA